MKNRTLYTSVAVSLLLMAVYLLSSGLRFVSIDEVAVYAVTRSMVGHGGLDASILHPVGRELSAYTVVVPGMGGQWYSVKDVGPSLLGVPVVALAHATGVSPVRAMLLLPPLVTAASGGLLYAIAVTRTSHRVAVAAALIFGLATPAWPYGLWLYTQPFAAFGLMLALFATTRPKTPGWALLAGLGVGYSVASAIPFALTAPLIALALTRRNASLWAAFAAGLGLMLGALGLYSALRFGSPLTNAYIESGGAGRISLFNLPTGLFGLLLSTPRGVLWYAPLLVLVPVGVWQAWQRREGWYALPLAVVLVVLPVYAGFSEWWGVLSPGTRFLSSFMGPLVLLCVPAIEAADRGALRRALLGGVVAVSALIQALSAFFNAFSREEVAIVEALLPLLPPARFGDIPPPLLDPAWLPLPRLLNVAGRGEWDTLWMSSGRLDAPLLVALLALTGVGALNLMRGRRWHWLGLHAALLVGVTGWMLARYPTVGGEFNPQQVFMPPDIPRVAETVSTQAQPGDGVLVVLPFAYLRWLDAYPEPVPDYGIPFEAELLPTTRDLLVGAAANHERLWLVAEGSDAGNPALGAERWLADNAYAGSTQWIGDYRVTLYTGAGHTPGWAPLGTGYEGLRLEAGAVRFGAYSADVALRWRAERDISADYLVVVQLLGPGGQLAAQNVGRPHAAYSPTFRWAAGDVIEDRHALTLPSPLPPGEYTVIAGLLDVITGERLPTLSGADHTVVGTLTR